MRKKFIGPRYWCILLKGHRSWFDSVKSNIICSYNLKTPMLNTKPFFYNHRPIWRRLWNSYHLHVGSSIIWSLSMSRSIGLFGSTIDIYHHLEKWGHSQHICTGKTEINSSFSWQNGRHFADDIFRCIFVNDFFLFRLQFHWSLFLRV